MTETDYAAYRDERTRAGEEYQDFVLDLLYKRLRWPIMQHVSAKRQITMGESASCVEIKFQDRYRKTGNLWIETEEKAHPRPGAYAPAGITDRPHDNAIFLVTGDYTTVFFFAKAHLQKLATSPRYPIIENHSKTSRGFLLPDRVARFVADHVWSLPARPAAPTAAAPSLPRASDPSAPFGRVTEADLKETGRICFGLTYDGD